MEYVCGCVAVIIQVAQLKMLEYKNNAETLFPIYDGAKIFTYYIPLILRVVQP